MNAKNASEQGSDSLSDSAVTHGRLPNASNFRPIVSSVPNNVVHNGSATRPLTPSSLNPVNNSYFQQPLPGQAQYNPTIYQSQYVQYPHAQQYVQQRVQQTQTMVVNHLNQSGMQYAVVNPPQGQSISGQFYQTNTNSLLQQSNYVYQVVQQPNIIPSQYVNLQTNPQPQNIVYTQNYETSVPVWGVVNNQLLAYQQQQQQQSINQGINVAVINNQYQLPNQSQSSKPQPQNQEVPDRFAWAKTTEHDTAIAAANSLLYSCRTAGRNPNGELPTKNVMEKLIGQIASTHSDDIKCHVEASFNVLTKFLRDNVRTSLSDFTNVIKGLELKVEWLEYENEVLKKDIYGRLQTPEQLKKREEEKEIERKREIQMVVLKEQMLRVKMHRKNLENEYKDALYYNVRHYINSAKKLQRSNVIQEKNESQPEKYKKF